jgi:hypothetical protein
MYGRISRCGLPCIVYSISTTPFLLISGHHRANFKPVVASQSRPGWGWWLYINGIYETTFILHSSSSFYISVSRLCITTCNTVFSYAPSGFWATVKARAPSPGFGFADLKPKHLSSPDFSLAWLCEARALAFGLSGFKPSQAHH